MATRALLKKHISPVAGGWSFWSGWSPCSCPHPGTQSRERSCTQPKPQHGGAQCEGEKTESRECEVDWIEGIDID